MITEVSEWLRGASQIAVLTGAGISAESGVPVFRGHSGLWRQFRAEDLATPDAFARQPALVWEWYLWRRALIARATPNEGHRVLARLQQHKGATVTLLSQNVDGLHRRAGSPSVIELHGNLWRVRCADDCGLVVHDVESDPPRTNLRCRCGAWLRPDVVWFGEPLDAGTLQRATTAVEQADVVLVVGTSAVVYPVAALPEIARRRRARIVEVNIDETPLTPRVDAHLRGPAASILPQLEEQL
jgi:NAD-dependent protein deacetylase/lipoamidase